MDGATLIFGFIFAVLFLRCCTIWVPGCSGRLGCKTSVIFLILTTAVNIVLDVLFVAVFKMGIFGAALATILAQASSAVFVLRTLLRTKESYRLVLSGCKSYPEVFQQIVRLGLPSGFQYMLYTVSNLVIQARVICLAQMWRRHGR